MAAIVRTGIFYDGSFFARVSDHYRYQHDRAARISIGGFHELVRHEVASNEKVDPTACRLVEAHYFRGRFPAEEAERHDALLRERRFEDVLIRAGITPHFLLMPTARAGNDGAATPPVREKGTDVWLALEAYEIALRRGLDVVVLVTGDSDFLQLVRKLTAIGTRTLLTAWDLERSRTRTAQVLIDAVTYPVMMSDLIDARDRRNDPMIDNLFMSPSSGDQPSEAEAPRVVEPVGVREARVAARAPEAVSAEPLKPSEVASGVINNVIYDKGFGFIRPDWGGENLFFHANDVEGCEFAELHIQDPVRFVVASNPRDGRPQAVRVSPRWPSGNV
ncbi:MAG: NYN domain-containing protein [Gammaproteobacteria bacterium]|nr:NYN domain-containing protein [Gammaproteobacteria bacterium]MYB38700.1 NYN domain-containing protein [Gammaproteobacteria bacterium]